MAAQEADGSGWAIEGLAADGPEPSLRGRLMLFGQFVGDWDIVENRYIDDDDGTWKTGRGEVHWRWILNGRGVQDVWSDYEAETGRVIPVGTTVRFYSAELNAWHSVWISPLQGKVRKFLATRVGDEIVLDGATNPDGTRVRWIFYDITPNEFRWRAERRAEGDPSWNAYEKMIIRRKPGR